MHVHNIRSMIINDLHTYVYSVDTEISDGPEKLSSNSSNYSSNNHDKNDLFEKEKPEELRMMTSELDEKPFQFLDAPKYSKLNRKRQAAGKNIIA